MKEKYLLLSHFFCPLPFPSSAPVILRLGLVSGGNPSLGDVSVPPSESSNVYTAVRSASDLRETAERLLFSTSECVECRQYCNGLQRVFSQTHSKKYICIMPQVRQTDTVKQKFHKTLFVCVKQTDIFYFRLG